MMGTLRFVHPTRCRPRAGGLGMGGCHMALSQGFWERLRTRNGFDLKPDGNQGLIDLIAVWSALAS
ncbi:hypothetical protein JCM14469_15930 [Desulfatiferula olefinivorans]